MMTNSWKQLLMATAGAVALGGLAVAQDSEQPPEEASAGVEVSSVAQGFADLDPAEVDGPGLSAAAQELRGIALANLPEQGASNLPEQATAGGMPDTASGSQEVEEVEGDDEGEGTGPGLAVSEAAQNLESLDQDEAEGPGLSQAAQELRGIAMANLPEEALKNRAEQAGTAGPPEGVGRPADAGPPDTPGRPETPDRPETPERPDRPDRPERPETPERPERPDRPDRPGRPGG